MTAFVQCNCERECFSKKTWWEKEKKYWYPAFSPSPTVPNPAFSPSTTVPNHTKIIIQATFNFSSLTTINLVQSKLMSFGKELE